MTTRQRFLAGMIGSTLAAAIILGVTIKDTGLVHGTLDPAALYCENYEARLNVHFDADERAECEDDYRSLPLDTRRELLRNIMSDDG